MTRVATGAAADVPADASTLCEGCGYTLDKLPVTANCPECGKPIAESTVDDGRAPSTWEARGSVAAFLWTSLYVLLRPSHFFRHTTARGDLRSAFTFAAIYWALSAILFGAASWFHQLWYSRLTGWRFVTIPFLIALIVATFAFLWVLTNLASRLTVWEARYRGIRLPRAVVLRGLYFHAAHYVPVGIIALITTAGYLWLVRRRVFGPETADRYLWTLSAEVVIAAAYLFWTYWAAMRNMMYANR